MEQMEQIVNTLSLSMGAAWASGVNLYAALLMLGIMGSTGNILLPDSLQILTNPLVIGAAGLMFVVEFFADKIPGVDSAWDGLHTFIRIPAGAMLAAGAVGEVEPAVGIAAAIMGGGISATSHAAKAGTRVLINTSPEPVTNWTASVLEDIAVIGGLWAALHHPWLFLGLFVVFLVLLAWLLPKLWKGVKAVFRTVGRLFGLAGGSQLPPAAMGKQHATTAQETGEPSAETDRPPHP